MQALPDPNQYLLYALAFLRIGGIVFALPLIGDSPVPMRVRAFLAVALTMGLTPLIPPNWAPDLQADVLMIANYVIRELTIGLIIGFVARLAFDGIVMAAGVVAYQMGFGTGSLFIPDLGDQIDSFSAFHRYVVLLMFLSLNLHHVFFSGMIETFRLIPGGAAGLQGGLGLLLIQMTSGVFAIAVQLAAPILVALLFAMAALGLVSRAVPQFNVFVMSFPVSFGLGLVVYVATFPFFPEWMHDYFEQRQADIFTAVRLMIQ